MVNHLEYVARNFKWCDIHLREYVNTCSKCVIEGRASLHMQDKSYACGVHAPTFNEDCRYCRSFRYWGSSTKRIRERQKKLDDAWNSEERNEHRNEHCLICDKALLWDEWFCYCCLCPDCYIKNGPSSDDDEAYDDYGDLKEIV